MRPIMMGIALASALVLVACRLQVSAQVPAIQMYRVTLSNLTTSQPLSPPVAVTHPMGFHIFEVGQLASEEIRAIAEDGEPMPLVDALAGPKQGQVSGVVNVGRPLTRKGTTMGEFTDSATFQIRARPGDRFSLATMLICTNDGFTGLDGAELPASGSQTYMLMSYDAGTENNTEKSADIVDPCSELGPERLPGDPNGNDDTGKAVNTDPPQPIQMHPGILGGGDLKPELHRWTDPVLMVTIERLS